MGDHVIMLFYDLSTFQKERYIDMAFALFITYVDFVFMFYMIVFFSQGVHLNCGDATKSIFRC